MSRMNPDGHLCDFDISSPVVPLNADWGEDVVLTGPPCSEFVGLPAISQCPVSSLMPRLNSGNVFRMLSPTLQLS